MSRHARTVLLVGSGGREHALAWKLSRSPVLARLIVAPGNDGMPREWERWNLAPGLAGLEGLARQALEAHVDLAVIGPDNPLADGIVDIFETAGIPCFGPRADAARLESSKAFAKDVMTQAGIPTAEFTLARGAAEAREFLNRSDWDGGGWVLKADGLALGKGVAVCDTREEALRALAGLAGMGTAADTIVIERKLTGRESSWLAFCDGERCALFEPARDHKRVFDGDEGPNTGGMGAYSPVPDIPAPFSERVRREVFLPALAEMKKRGTPFRGVLYAGLMIDASRDRFWVLEFNCRFGDPETQVLLARMSDDLLPWCEAVARGDLGALPDRVGMLPDAAVVVVAAAPGYPEKPEKGAVIEGPLSQARQTGELPAYFCAGVARSEDGKLRTSGGRVFGAMGVAPSLTEAAAQAYRRLAAVRFHGMHFRTDIARGMVVQ